jgi:hypothetical protein
MFWVKLIKSMDTLQETTKKMMLRSPAEDWQDTLV